MSYGLDAGAMKAEIFSAPSCTYCEQAKSLLQQSDIPYDEYDIAQDPAHKSELLRRLPAVRTLPQVFIDGSLIGGMEDLRHHLQNLARKG